MGATAIGADEDVKAPLLQGVDFVEFYVGNATQAAHFYRSAFGFLAIATAGLETGVRDQMSIVLQHGDVRFVLTSALVTQNPIADSVRVHGDAVKDIAFTVESAEAAFEHAVSRGARPLLAPSILEDDRGRLVRATIGGPGDLVHSFVERREYKGRFLPGYRTNETQPQAAKTLFRAIDHIACAVEHGTLASWTSFYRDALGFEEVPQEDTATERSAMRSTVVQTGDGAIRFPLVEPAESSGRSQIEEYISFHGGPGAQHVALLTDDILATVRHLQNAGVEFLKIPPTYYNNLVGLHGHVQQDVATLEALGVLFDRDEWGTLLQTFTKPIQSRPTLFLEIIERNRARGFGARNIRALFEAVELEQAARGNL